MYNQNGTFYTEEHSISFGEVVNGQFVSKANTWTDWHLIPSSKPVVIPPTFVTKYIDIPGTDGQLDLTDYLTGGAVFGQSQGQFSFIVDNDHEKWESIREKMVYVLHGKRIKMRLDDWPNVIYDGRFTVGNWESGNDRSAINISYQLEPGVINL